MTEERPTVVQRVRTRRGELVLRRAGRHFEIISNGTFLMDSRDGRSERLLVRAALDAYGAGARVLIGGLGVGFSLIEAVEDAAVRRVTVLEIEPAVIAWHRGPLAESTATALADPRVDLVCADLVDWLATATTHDVICLDIDNGPDWTVRDRNAALYTDQGIDALRAALAPSGVLAVWSAAAAPAFEAALRDRFGWVQVRTVPVPRGEPDRVYLAADRVDRPAP